MAEQYSKNREIAEAAFSKLQARPLNSALQDIYSASEERYVKTARLRELRMATNRFKKK